MLELRRCDWAETASEANDGVGGDDHGEPPLLGPGADYGLSTSLNADASLAEFRELVLSAGATVVGQVLQRKSRPDPATLIGAGKVEEIAGIAESNQADLVLFDHDLTPTQLRNLERLLPCAVLDRTQLILDIFARHAQHSRGPSPSRISAAGIHAAAADGARQGDVATGRGGIGTRGPGETKLETDRRAIEKRLVQSAG